MNNTTNVNAMNQGLNVNHNSMNNQLNIWTQRMRVFNKPRYSIKDIMFLLDVGQTTATKIRDRCLTYMYDNGIPIMGDRAGIESEVFIKVTGKDFDYFYQHCEQEQTINRVSQPGLEKAYC